MEWIFTLIVKSDKPLGQMSSFSPFVENPSYFRQIEMNHLEVQLPTYKTEIQSDFMHAKKKINNDGYGLFIG